jgi:hypothetical protein
MTSFWIADANRMHAVVDSADERDIWVRIRGWMNAGEPGPADQVWVRHPAGLFGCVPFEALAAGWAELGWELGPPPDPAGTTTDPAPRDVAVPKSKKE